jgi:hypothetical protein
MSPRQHSLDRPEALSLFVSLTPARLRERVTDSVLAWSSVLRFWIAEPEVAQRNVMGLDGVKPKTACVSNHGVILYSPHIA